MSEAESVVRPILEDVRKRGDRALLEYARRFDGFTGKSVRIPLAARHTLAPEFRAAVKTAAANVHAFAELQKPREWSAALQPGLTLGQVVRPLDTVAA